MASSRRRIGLIRRVGVHRAGVHRAGVRRTGARNARQALHRLEQFDLAIRTQPAGLETPGGRQYLLLPGTHCLVESIAAAAERLSEPAEVLAEYRQALVQFLAEVADFRGIVRECRL